MIQIDYEVNFTIFKKDGTWKLNRLYVTTSGLQQAIEVAEEKLAPIMQDPAVEGVTIWSINFLRGKLKLMEESKE